MLLRLQNAFRSMTSMIREQERIANNLANVNTVGYRRDRTFTQALEEYIDVEGGPQSERDTQQWAVLEQGPLEATGNPFDLAIQGDGFFVLNDAETGAARYTRAGRFLPDGDGFLRDPHGHLVEGANGPIQLPPNVRDVQVLKDGTLQINGQQVTTLRVVRFNNPMDLQRLDDASFAAPGQEPIEIDHPTVHQGFLEGSNVSPLHEMTDMIEHFRLFESQQKMIQTSDQILGAVTRDLGKF